MRRLLFALVISIATIPAFGQARIDYRVPGAPLPPFTVEETSGKTITNSVLPTGKPVIIMLFSPQCDHCQHALDSLRGVAGLFKKTQLIPVVEARNKPYLKDFMAKNGFDKVPLFRHAGIDKGNLVAFIYTYGLLPQFNVYNEQHRLVKTFSGNFPMDSLKMYIR